MAEIIKTYTPQKIIRITKDFINNTTTEEDVTNLSRITVETRTNQNGAPLSQQSLRFEFEDLDPDGYKSIKKLKFSSVVNLYVLSITSNTPQYAQDIIFCNVKATQAPSYGEASSLQFPMDNKISTEYPYSTRIETTSVIATIDGLGGSYPPVARLVWEDPTPVPVITAPTRGSFIDEQKESPFSFNIQNMVAEDGSGIPATATFEWKEASAASYNEIDLGEKNKREVTVTIPANTFGNGQFEWRIRTRSTIDTTLIATSASNTFTTIDTAPTAPTNLKPQNDYVNKDEDNLFSWRYNVASGTDQASALLEYSSDGGATWQTLTTVAGPNTFATIPAGTFSNGEILWRVKTTGSDGDESPYSDAAYFISRGEPDRPSITAVDSVPRLHIEWQANEQIAYKIIIRNSEGIVFDTGETYSPEKEWTSPLIIQPGEYDIELSTANLIGDWGTTITSTFISNEEGPSITLMANTRGDRIILAWTSDGTYTEYLVLRDGIAIAKVNETAYSDRVAAKGQYQVYGLNGGNYTPSNAVAAALRIKSAVIFDYEEDGPDVKLNLKKDSPVVIVKGRSIDSAFYHFAGAEYPTIYTGEQFSESVSIDITRKNNDIESIKKLLGKVLAYRDKTGESMFLFMNSIQ